MNKILIGSKALKYWFEDAPRNTKDTDTDYAVQTNTVGSSRDIEYLENPVLFKYLRQTTKLDNGLYVADPDMLYTLKLSHMFWDIQWNKHLFDILWLQDKKCKPIKPLFYELYSFWDEYHSKNLRSDLKMTASAFFDNALTCEHNHDFLHTLIKNPPTYTKVLVGEVEVCEQKFESLNFSDKLSLVQEEVYVMSYERGKNINYRVAYEKMLKKFIISHAPLWEALFILENYRHLYKPQFNHFKLIDSKLNIFQKQFITN